jgi:transcription antitermination factor NusG
MNWYCIHTRPKKESRVASYLSGELGLETYFPQLKQYKTIRRVRRLVTGPLFPRYLFCRFDLALGYRAVKYAPEIIGVVTLGSQPARVDPDLIDQLKSWAGTSVDQFTLQPQATSGDRVEIVDGPMRGLHAIILHERSDRERVAVMLSLLGGTVQKMFIARSQLALIA